MTTRLAAAADRAAHRITLWVADNWLEAAGLLILIAVAIGGAAAAINPDEPWSAIAVAETCYGVLLAIGIFTWTLAGFATRRAERQRGAAAAFAEEIGKRAYGRGELVEWQRAELARVLRVPENAVEDELLFWLVERSESQGGREVLAVTRRLWFLRLVARGAGGKGVFDLSTQQRI